MSQTSRLIDRRLAKALVFLQACMIPVAALLAWMMKDTTAALSAALGALVCWLAHCYFAWQSFRTAGARASKQVMLNMYRGMLGKFAIVIVGFILILELPLLIAILEKMLSKIQHRNKGKARK